MGNVEGCGDSGNRSKCTERIQNKCERDGIEVGDVGRRRKGRT